MKHILILIFMSTGLLSAAELTVKSLLAEVSVMKGMLETQESLVTFLKTYSDPEELRNNLGMAGTVENIAQQMLEKGNNQLLLKVLPQMNESNIEFNESDSRATFKYAEGRRLLFIFKDAHWYLRNR